MHVISFFVYTKYGDTMKTILFTGARSGIISGVIDKIKKKKYEIYVTVHTDTQLELVLKKYQNDKNVHCMKLDITDKEDRKKLCHLDIDILVCNGAVGYGGSIAEVDMNLVRHNFEVNVFSNFEVVQILIGNMIKKNSGRIIFMSSLAAIFPVPFLGPYAASKASISSLAATLRKELQYLHSNVEVAVIEPGFYHTGFNQVMFQNKYEWMDMDSYFANCLDEIHKREFLIEKFIEKKNLHSIQKQIIKAISSRECNKLYRAPFFQTMIVKGYQIFFE
jgi:short-subunit dehydrogenase